MHTSRTISAVLESCAACEYELKGEECPEDWGDRFALEPLIFEKCLQGRSESGSKSHCRLACAFFSAAALHSSLARQCLDALLLTDRAL